MKKMILLGLVCLLLTGCAGVKMAGDTVLGVIVNTFLDAYCVDDIYLSVDGHDLETGHNVYTEPLTKFSVEF